jgi:hypothetical protein
MTRENLATGIDQQSPASPPSHAGFRIAGIVVWDNRVDADATSEPFLCGCNNLYCAINLGSRRHQGGAIL